MAHLLLKCTFINTCICVSPEDQQKTDHLLALDGARERLQLYKASLLEEGSFEHAIDGCDAVFHTASPVKITVADPQVRQRYYFVQSNTIFARSLIVIVDFTG